MSTIINLGNKQKEDLSQVLSRHLSRNSQGKKIIAELADDSEQGGKDLVAYLDQRLPQDEALRKQIGAALEKGDREQFNTIVSSGGSVDQIINVAQLDELDIRYYVFSDVKQVIALLTVVVLVAGAIALAVWWSQQPSRMPEEDFNIAVARFGKIDSDGEIVGSSEATNISNSLFRFLESEFDNTDLGLNVNVGRKNLPLVIEIAEAEQLAERINADIVIYGQVYFDDENKSADFSPSFYVAESPDASEITGQSELAVPIGFELPVGSDNEVHEKLSQRASILILFTQGLVYLSADDLESARRTFTEAVDEARAYGQFEGREVLSLLVGTTYRLQGDLGDARDSFESALEDNPEYARAYIGIGNTYYTQFIENFDQDLGIQATTEYSKALAAKDHPRGALVIEKVNVALGNVYVVQAQGGGDQALFDKAVDHYSRVTERYIQTENERMKELAATAYFGLGAAYERQNETTKAISNYCNSISLTDELKLTSRAEDQVKILRGKC